MNLAYHRERLAQLAQAMELRLVVLFGSRAGGGSPAATARLSYRDTFLMLADHGVYPKEFAARIANSAGLRNILVHDYNDVDRRIVHASIRTCLRDYHRYLEHVGSFLRGLAPGQAGSGSGAEPGRTGSKKAAKPNKKRAKRKVAPKYKDPQSGAKREEFLIKRK